jgi:hypothetical protein
VSAESPLAWLGALVCWLALFLAAGLFALVSLSPKLVENQRLREDYEATQIRMVTLERQNAQLARIGDALEQDPEFASELARVHFESESPDEQRIQVSEHLSLQATGVDAEMPAPSEPPWYMPLVEKIAEDRQMSNAILCAAALLGLTSLVMRGRPGCEPQNDEDAPSGSVWSWLRDRYRASRS